jgi:hypothetical protein
MPCQYAGEARIFRPNAGFQGKFRRSARNSAGGFAARGLAGTAIQAVTATSTAVCHMHHVDSEDASIATTFVTSPFGTGQRA